MKRTPTVPGVLYHYTCRTHGEPGIRRSGTLRPFPHPILCRSLVWLTDLDMPDVWALGLTRHTLCCDRTQVRVTVHPHGDAAGNPATNSIAPWWFYARPMSRTLREILEDIGAPMHWWVSEKIVPISGMIATSDLLARNPRDPKESSHV
jgi:hypothetical protein